MAVKLEKRTVIGIKSETTQNTPITLTATDYFQAEDVNIEPVSEMLVRNFYRTTIGRIVTVPGRVYWKISGKTELKGSGTAGTPYAPLGAILKMAGWSETINAGVDVIYAPTSVASSANFLGPGISTTIEVYIDGVLHRAAGCMGKWKITLPGGKLPMVEFEALGLYETPTDVAFPTTTYIGTIAPKVQNSAFTMDGFSAVISQLELDSGAEYVPRDNISAANSLGGFVVTGRNPMAKFDPEHELVATHAFINKLVTGDTGTIACVVGATAGNICTLGAPLAQYQGLKYGSRNGIRTLDAELLLAEQTSGGNNELTLTFT